MTSNWAISTAVTLTLTVPGSLTVTETATAPATVTAPVSATVTAPITEIVSVDVCLYLNCDPAMHRAQLPKKCSFPTSACYHRRLPEQDDIECALALALSPCLLSLPVSLF